MNVHLFRQFFTQLIFFEGSQGERETECFVLPVPHRYLQLLQGFQEVVSSFLSDEIGIERARGVGQQFPVHLISVIAYKDRVARHSDATAQEQGTACRIFQQGAGKEHDLVTSRIPIER